MVRVFFPDRQGFVSQTASSIYFTVLFVGSYLPSFQPAFVNGLRFPRGRCVCVCLEQQPVFTCTDNAAFALV